jgi:ATP adenylyltransferase
MRVLLSGGREDEQSDGRIRGVIASSCPLCEKHRGEGLLVGPVIYQDDLVHVAHRATGPLGYVFIDAQRHVPYLGDLTDDEAAAVGRAASRLAAGLRRLLDIDFVHSMVAGTAVPHFHQHVFVRHHGTPDQYAWWEQWPDAPTGDIPLLAQQLGACFRAPG